MTTYRIYQFVRGETGITDVVISIYNSTGTEVVNDAAMTELGVTGIYYYDYTWTTAGNYICYIASATLGFATTQDLNLGVQVSSYTPSTTLTYLDVKYDIGEAWNQIDSATTSALINQLIGRAEDDVKIVTGTTAGYKQPIRYLTDAYAINHCLASLGPESDVETKLLNMRDHFIDLAKTAFRRKGKDYDGIQSAWAVVN